MDPNKTVVPHNEILCCKHTITNAYMHKTDIHRYMLREIQN